MMPYPNPKDNKTVNPPLSQHHSMRVPNDRSGIGMPQPSSTHCRPPNNMNLVSYNNFRRDFHHQPPRHLGNLPGRFNERQVRPFGPFNPSHAVPHHQPDESSPQFPVMRRGPPLSPRSENENSNSDNTQHLHSVQPPVRRNSHFPYSQGMDKYGEYSRKISGAGPHSPSLRPMNMRDGEVMHRFVPRPIQGHDRQQMLPLGPDSRKMVMAHDRGAANSSNRMPEKWRGTYDRNDYPSPNRPLRGSPPDETEYTRNRHLSQDENFPLPSMKPAIPSRSLSFERPRFRDPQTFHNSHPFDQNNGADARMHMRSFEHSSSKSESTDDDNESSIRSNDETSTPGKDELTAAMGCTCKKSKCLKLYCQCFASRAMCLPSCRCLSCMNVPKHEAERKEAVRAILMRNPNAFDTKFKASAEGKASKVTHKLGCKCRKSACLKKYCECYHADVKCSMNCRCTGCQNMPNSGPPPESSSRSSNYVSCMMDAAMDLAGLKHSPPRRPFPASTRNQLPVSRSTGEDLNLVPSLTASDSPSKDDEVFNDEFQPQVPQTNLSSQSQHQIQQSLKTNPGTSPVDVLLSAAYALTELQSSDHITNNKNTNFRNDSTDEFTRINVSSSDSNSTLLVSPSPKRKLSNCDYVPETPNDRSFQITFPPKRNRLNDGIVTPVSAQAEKLQWLRMNENGIRERLRDELENESFQH
mmetsp:Transcript_2190/g.2965  ORF Transcript_2190/g.2965 Transcript_2190/m.2965 type:complete len:694 (-) Transcript_2190:106-2187(-)